MRQRLIATFLLATAGLLSHTISNAEVIRCSNANGDTLYTDAACPAGMRTVRVTPLPQSCTTGDCEQRRERAIKEANDRVRAEKEELAAYAAERRKRELEDRWLDEARYEAEMRVTEVSHVSPDEVIYPVYPLAGIPFGCGMHCTSFPHQRRPPLRGIGDTGEKHHGNKDPGNRVAVRSVGKAPLRAMGGKPFMRLGAMARPQ